MYGIILVAMLSCYLQLLKYKLQSQRLAELSIQQKGGYFCITLSLCKHFLLISKFHQGKAAPTLIPVF